MSPRSWLIGGLFLLGLSACATQQLDLEPPRASMLQAVERTAGIVYDGKVPSRSNASISIGSGSALYRDWAHSAIFANSGSESSNPCNESTASTLDALGFEADQIRSIRYDIRVIRTREGNNRLQGVNAWVTFNDQTGYVVLAMNQTCGLMGYSTRAGASLPGDA